MFIEPEAVRVFCKAAKIRPVTPVAHEVLHRAGELLGALAGHGQVMVDFLTQPAERIGRNDAYPRLCGMVGTATLPGRAQIKKGAALDN